MHKSTTTYLNSRIPSFFSLQPRSLVAKLTLILTLFSLPGFAQQRFSAAVEAGLTASQIDGDLSAGYNKLGMMAGVRGIVNLQRKTHASIGILFAQRGAQAELTQNTVNFFSIRTNYVEVPVMIHYADWLVEDGDDSYYKAYIQGGFSYGRLINAKERGDLTFARAVINPSNTDKQYLNNTDISLTVGGNLFFNRNVGLGVRWMRSLNFLYNPRKHDPAPLEVGWQSHALTFSLLYRVF